MTGIADLLGRDFSGPMQEIVKVTNDGARTIRRDIFGHVFAGDTLH